MTRDERQEEARVKWIKSKCKGTIVAGTGFGKTTTAFKCIKSVIDKYPNLRVLVVVPTDNLKDQWSGQLPIWDLEFNTEVQVINSVVKHDWKCDILVLDECHRYNSEVFSQIFERVKYKYILGLTATFERLDGKHELMRKFCPIIDEISLADSIANGWISDYKEYQVIIHVDDIDTYKTYNKQFQEAFEYLGYDFSLAMSLLGPQGFINRARLRDERCPNGTEEQRKAVFKQITYYATSFMRAIQQRKAFINNHPKKVEIARKIIESRPFSKIVTFSNNVKMAESIGYGQVYTGKDTKKKGRIKLEEFNAQTTGIMNSCAKLNEGADIKGLSVAIILGLDSSEIKAVQRRGRCVRFEEGKTAEIFNIIIAGTVEESWFANSHKSSNYITIDEQGLEDVLAGKEPRPYQKPTSKFTFRF